LVDVSEEFQPGDRVRVTFETEYPGGLPRISNATVELIERKDDPSKDLVGTIRRNTGGFGGSYIRMQHHGEVVWTCVFADGSFTLKQPDVSTLGPIIAAIPDTPAAEKQAADELSRQTGDEERKLWFGVGSEEPPAHVKKVRWLDFDPEEYGSDVAQRGSNGQWYWGSHSQELGTFTFVDLAQGCPGRYVEVRNQ
jgi:hypothetical protein